MKKVVPVVLSLLGTVCMMGLIYWFSGQPGTQSHGYSRPLAEWLLNILSSRFHIEGIPVLKMEYCLRKLAHFSLYFILGSCLGGSLRRQRKIPPFVLVLLAGALFAASDELHQCFIQARSPNVLDIAIDICGTASGGFLLVRKRKNRSAQA